MGAFFDKHGTVILLYSIVAAAFGITVWLGVHIKVDPEKVFAFAAGFAGGAFSGLTVAMKVQPDKPPVSGPPSQGEQK